MDAGRFAEALPRAEELVANQEELFGPDDPETAHCLNILGYLLHKSGRSRDAVPHHQEALRIFERAPDSEEAIFRTNGFLGLAWWLAGESASAVPHLERAAELSREIYGAEHLETGVSLGSLGRVLADLPDAAGARRAFGQALEIVERLDPEHPERSRYLSGLGSALKAEGDYEAARGYFERALEATVRALGAEHPEAATDHSNLGTVLELLGEIEAAETHYERALALSRRYHGDRHPDTANNLSNLGSLRERQGDYAAARQLYEEALSIREELLGPDHPQTAITLTNLGHLLKATGDLRGARERYERVLAIRKAKLGPRHPKTAASLNNLAAVVEALGDLARARELYERALAIRREVLGAEHPSTAISLNNLGLVVAAMGDPMLALRMLTEALEIREAVYPPDHPEIATNVANLGMLFRFTGDLESVRAYRERALAMRLRSLGPDHPSTALSHHNLGVTLLQLSELESSREHLERAVSIRESVLGADHPNTASSRLSLAVLERQVGRIDRAVSLTRQVVGSRESRLVPLLASGSDADKRLLLRTESGLTDWTLTLHLHSPRTDREAARLALTMILRSKGRALEETLGGQLEGRNMNGEDAEMLARLKALREQQSVLSRRAPDDADPDRRRNQLAELRAEARMLEAKLAERSLAFRRLHAPVTIEAVQAKLEPSSALVELVVFRPLDPRAGGSPFGDPRYAAYILRSAGEPVAVDLGPAEQIDEAVAVFRRALAPPRPDIVPLSEALDRLTLEKIRPLLGDAGHLIVSPDGELNLVPFAALADSQDGYLIERFRLSYVTSGRDLLDTASEPESREPSLLVGGPDFDAVPEGWRDAADAEDSGDLLPPIFPSLPGAATEVAAIGDVLGLGPERVLTGRAATEAAVKAARGPRILHLATHGFFLPDLPLPSAPGPVTDLLFERAAESREDALLRSGLALAGYNRRRQAPGADDGVLTGLEVLSLDLRGTELVTLSACQTGVGEVRAGRGVFGLRRALALAGARSQMMSLWQVDDQATRTLMTSWYAQLRAGVPGDDALRRVQLAALSERPLPVVDTPLVRGPRPIESRRVTSRHPYYWASFIFVGTGAGSDASTEGHH